MYLPYVSQNAFMTAAAVLLLIAGPVLAGDDKVSESWLQQRNQDYQRFDPGVPAWPSTCDCIRVAFSSPDSKGKRTTRFSFAKAESYYSADWMEVARDSKSEVMP